MLSIKRATKKKTDKVKGLDTLGRFSAIQAPSEMGSAPKGKNLLKFFPFGVEPAFFLKGDKTSCLPYVLS